MKLEEAIQQKTPFRSQREKAIVNLIYTQNWVAGKMKDHFAMFEITPKQYNILRILKGAQSPVSIAYIRARLLDRLSDVSRIIDRLQSRGLVDKKPSDVDRRLIDVKLSYAGDELVQKISNAEKGVRDIMSRLTDEDIHVLNGLLEKIRQ